MQTFRAILIIGIIEILIGSFTLFGNLSLILLGLNNKSPNVLAFVLLSACASALIGVRLLKLSKTAYNLLIYFSSVIILTKLLMYAGIIQLNGELEVTLDRMIGSPFTEFVKQTINTLKNMISIAYHSYIIYYLRHGHVRTIFHR